jgi:hypothetical protein
MSHERQHRPEYQNSRLWNLQFLGLSIIIATIFWFFRPNAWPQHLVYIVVWLIPFSRINEIPFAFCNDAIQQLKRNPRRTRFTPVQRLGYLGASYIEIALNFAILYFFLPDGMFSRRLTTIIHALYFSWVTITTTGYGEITPQCATAQLLCMWEVAIGLLLVVLVVGSYISASQQSSSDVCHSGKSSTAEQK